MKDTTTDDAVASERDGIEEVFVCDEDCPDDEHLSEALDHLSEAILAFNLRVWALQRQMARRDVLSRCRAVAGGGLRSSSPDCDGGVVSPPDNASGLQ